MDHQGVFTDIYIGWLGRVHDAHVFSNFDLFRRGRMGSYFLTGKRTLMAWKYLLLF